MTTKKKIFIKVPTRIVRNEEFKLNNGEFLLYTYLCFYYFRNPSRNKKEIKLNHKDLMLNCRITDTRTLKKRFKSLHEAGLIENEIIKLSNKCTLTIHFNEVTYAAQNDYHFTKMDAGILRYFNNQQINDYALRQAFYYKSHINPSKNKMFCFVSFETLVERLGVSKDKINEANKMLKKAKLIRVHKHKLETTYSYDGNDALIFDKFNNHYFVSETMF